MKSEILYPIKYVANCTEIPPYLIRTWETRYGVVSPVRSSSNRRLYRSADIQRLHLLKRAVDYGYNISQVANLSPVKLSAITADISSRMTEFPLVSRPRSPRADIVKRKLMRHIADLDANGLEAALNEAAVSFTKPDLILKVLAPIYKRVADALTDGALREVHLNMATMIIRAFLWEMLRTAAISKSAPIIVIATPLGHHNEISALTLALTAVESGWQSIYFGPNLPAVDIAKSVKSKQAQAAALSISSNNDNKRLRSELATLRQNVDGDVKIFICDNNNLLQDYSPQFNEFITKSKNFRQTLEKISVEAHYQ